MTWVKIDDRAPEHRKLLAAGPMAAWLWVCGLAYANRQPARDGFVPEAALPMLYPFGGTLRKLAERLVEAGLWERVPHGFAIHDYHDFQPTKVDAEQVSARKAAAGRAGGLRSGQARRSKTEAQPQAGAKHGASPVASLLPKPDPDPDPVPGTETRELAPAAHPLTLTSAPARARRRPAHTAEQVAAKDQIVDAFSEAFAAAKGVKPSLDHEADQAAAFALAAKYGPDEGTAIVREALADPWVLRNNPTLRYIASKPDTWRGTSPAVRRPGSTPLQPVPEGGAQWKIGGA
jgi:hypothetical protein